MAQSRVAAVLLMAAVMPDPHEVTTGLPPAARSTPAALKIACSSSLGLSVAPGSGKPSRTAAKGTLTLPGTWPPRMPGRGSGASPVKRGPGRASTSVTGGDSPASL